VREGRESRKTNTLVAKLEQPAPEFFAAARARIAKEHRGYPAPLVIVDCVEAAVTLPFAKGVQRERELFEKLKGTTESKALRHLFFAERQVTKIPDVPEDTPVRDIKSAAVLGAGTMGGGIAMNFANAGIPVKVLELSQEALDKGLGVVKKNYAATVSKGRLSQEDMDKRVGLLKGVTSYDELKQADIRDRGRVRRHGGQEAGVREARTRPASRERSSPPTLRRCDVNEIAAMTSRPESVIGLHFFSPANVMRLLEVVRAAKTSKEVLATSMKLAKTIKKVGVVAGVCDGFIGNRMLHGYFREAGFLLEEGRAATTSGQGHRGFWFCHGTLPCERPGRTRCGLVYPQATGRYASAESALFQGGGSNLRVGRFGQKTGAGWYRYDAGNRAAIPDP
jgi:3-hydroxyacyl-CoA dehydrogenase